jgi:hypothetical protein
MDVKHLAIYDGPTGDRVSIQRQCVRIRRQRDFAVMRCPPKLIGIDAEDESIGRVA